MKEVNVLNITGVVAEYNPFHNGHRYHLEKSKEITKSDFCIVAMSGNYVQRGEPAILDKWIRTEIALKNGADIVIEIPSLYSSSSAEIFASNAIYMLHSTNIVNSICFGTESDSIENITDFADILYSEPVEYQQILKSELSKGIVFPKARENALKIYTGKNSDILKSPNNILAIEYIKAIKRLKSDIVPYCIKRIVSQYYSKDIHDSIASATAVREAIKYKNYSDIKNAIPENCYDIFFESIYSGKAPIFLDNLSEILNYILRVTDLKKISAILDMTEGIENRISNISQSNFKISDIVSKVKTKRYTYTKIQRAILHLILNLKKSDLELHPQVPYLKILGFNKNCEFLLSELTKKASIPVITNLKNAQKKLSNLDLEFLKREAMMTDIYFLASPNLDKRLPYREYTMPIIVL